LLLLTNFTPSFLFNTLLALLQLLNEIDATRLFCLPQPI